MLSRLLCSSVGRLAPVLAAAMFTAVGLATPVSAADPVQIRASTIPSTDNGAFESARAKGFFKEEGIEIDTTPLSGGAAGIPALVAGQIQIASSNIVSIVLAAAHGLDVVIVGAGDTTADAPPDLAGLVTAKGNALHTGKDLEGKKIAVNARNNIIWLYAREWVAQSGGDPEKVEFVEVPFPQMMDAVRTGRVDAAMMVEPFLSGGVNDGLVDVVSWPYSEVHKNSLVAEFVTTKAYAAEHPDIVQAFVNGHNKGVDWANANKDSDEFFGIVSGYTKVDPAKLKTSAIPVFIKTIDPAQVEYIVSLMKKHHLIDGDIDTDALIHPLIKGAK